MAKHIAYLLGIGKVMGSVLGPNRVIAKYVKILYLLLLCQMRDINGMSFIIKAQLLSKYEDIRYKGTSFRNFLVFILLLYLILICRYIFQILGTRFLFFFQSKFLFILHLSFFLNATNALLYIS